MYCTVVRSLCSQVSLPLELLHHGSTIVRVADACLPYSHQIFYLCMLYEILSYLSPFG